MCNIFSHTIPVSHPMTFDVMSILSQQIAHSKDEASGAASLAAPVAVSDMSRFKQGSLFELPHENDVDVGDDVGDDVGEYDSVMVPTSEVAMLMSSIHASRNFLL